MQDSKNIGYLLKGFSQLVAFDNFKWEWLSQITPKIKSEEDWNNWANIVLQYINHSSTGTEIIIVILNKCKVLSKHIFELMIRLNISPNEMQIKWILGAFNQHPDLCTQVIENFT